MAEKRHQRAKHEVIRPWPKGLPPPEVVAERARYVSSSEHKDYESDAGPPALRSDAARCDPRYTDFEAITIAVREAIRRACSGSQFEGDFPRHVWGWFDGRLYEARLINAERPKDDEGRLNW
jgi:hypothetical protein